MNLSDLTRREQVLAYLRARTGFWVDGPDLANERVGGSEGLKRLRELRADGFNIQTRKHPDPDRDIYQYRIMPGKAPVDPQPDRVEINTSTQDVTGYDEDNNVVFHKTYEERVADQPRHRPPVDHVRERELRRTAGVPPPPPPTGKIRDAIRVKEDGTFEYVPPQQPLIGQLTVHPDPPPEAPATKFDSLPAHVEYGTVAVCPRCRSKTTRGRTQKEQADTRGKKSGSALVDFDGVLLFRDPTSSKAKPCERCNGYGIIPNVGPIPMTPPDGAKP